MEPLTTGRHAIDRGDMLAHDWRVWQLTRLGLPGSLAGACAGRIDGVLSPGWCGAAARRSWLCVSSADAGREDPR